MTIASNSVALAFAVVVQFATTVPAQQSVGTREAQLLRGLSTGSVAARRVAILAARQIETPKLVARITEIAHTEGPLALRWNAIDTLGYYRNANGTNVLLSIQRRLRDNGADVRLIAATFEALGRRRDPKVFERLVAALDGDVLEVRGAVKGLGLLADRRAYDPLLRTLKPYKHNVFFGRDFMRAMFDCDRARAISFFCTAIRDRATPQPYRFRFEQLLAEAAGADVADAAHALLKADFAEAVDRGLRILGACKRTSDVPRITKILHSKPEHRLASVTALAIIAHELTVQDLLRYLADDNAQVRAKVADALGRIGAKRATPGLANRLAEEEDLRTRIRIVESLGLLRDSRAIASLMHLLQDRSLLEDSVFLSSTSQFPGNTEIRYVALWALQRIRDGKAEFDFKLKNPSQWERAAPATEFENWEQWWRANQTNESFRIR